MWSLSPVSLPARQTLMICTNQAAHQLTIIFVCIQEILELKVEDLQVFFYQDALADLGQAVLGALMEIGLNPLLLLLQSHLSLLTDQHSSAPWLHPNH